MKTAEQRRGDQGAAGAMTTPCSRLSVSLRTAFGMVLGMLTDTPHLQDPWVQLNSACTGENHPFPSPSLDHLYRDGARAALAYTWRASGGQHGLAWPAVTRHPGAELDFHGREDLFSILLRLALAEPSPPVTGCPSPL